VNRELTSEPLSRLAYNVVEPAAQDIFLGVDDCSHSEEHITLGCGPQGKRLDV